MLDEFHCFVGELVDWFRGFCSTIDARQDLEIRFWMYGDCMARLGSGE